MALTYKDAGVDVGAGEDLVNWLKASPFGKKNHRDNILSGIGGFASLFRFDFQKYKKPLLVSCTDGVGTKVKLAADFEAWDYLGQDLVAMCVNDLICCGADPLFFLDYYATGKLHLDSAKRFLTGVQKACDDSECALIGGETAEMPGVYAPGEIDCAGFAVGAVDEALIFGPHRVLVGDRLVGVSSSGFHSNGYSLLRKVFEKDIKEWLDVLIKPTHLYVKLVAELKKSVELHALAHITGEGIENVPRVIPHQMAWKYMPWSWPEAFREVQSRTGLTDSQMLRTLNCGVGFVLVLPHSEVEKARDLIQSLGFQSFDLGEIVVKPETGEEILGI